MSETYIVGFDGSETSHRALEYARDRALRSSAHIHLVFVMEWSPFSFHTPEELAERHKRREEELDRANALVQPAVKELTEAGVEASCEARHGNAADLLCQIANDKGAAQIVIGRTGDSSFAQRLVGSLAITLAQAAPVPVTIVP